MSQTKIITLKEMVETFTQELYSWACYKVSDKEHAKDLVQDTFLAAAEKIESFKGNSSPKTWLFSILNHKIIDSYRKKIKQHESMDDQVYLKFFTENGSWKESKAPAHWDYNEQHLLDNDEFQAVLKKCLDALPEKWNLCVKLKYLSEKNSEEICQELNIAHTNMWQIIHRAKLQLRDCVEINWFKN